MSKLKNLYIIGAGGFGREAAWAIERINAVKPEWNIQGYVDDDSTLLGSSRSGYPVLGNIDYLRELNDDYWVLCAIANAKARKRVVDTISQFEHLHFPTLVDPDAIISNHNVTIGEGSIICAGCILTVDIHIGKHNIIDVGSTIGHDASLNDFVTLYPSVNISGNVLIEDAVEIGTGTQVIQGKQIGQGSIIGAGAVVISNLPSQCTAVGVPAKIIKQS